MLREHLTQEHGAASRKTEEIEQQINWFWDKLGLQSGNHLLDVTCGPGLYSVQLAQRDVRVTGTDFGPAAVEYARELAKNQNVTDMVTILETDVRTWDYPAATYDAALLIYGQLAVMSKDEAQTVLTGICQSLKPGSKLVIELLNQERVDTKDSTWWYTDEKRLWGDAPFMLLGERKWYAAEKLSMERYFTVHLETGQLDEVVLNDQTYSTEEMTQMMHTAGFTQVQIYPDWDTVPLYDSKEWIVYVAQK